MNLTRRDILGGLSMASLTLPEWTSAQTLTASPQTQISTMTLPTSCPSIVPAALTTTLQRRQQLVQDIVALYNLPSLSVAIANATGVVFAYTVGLADVKSNTPAGNDSIYRIASVSKPFTSSAMMLAASTGRSNADDLDETVLGPGLLYKYKINRPAPGVWGGVTVRQLLSHTSGSPTNDCHDPMFIQNYRNLSDLDFLYKVVWDRCVNDEPNIANGNCPISPTGSIYRYSNFGYFVLGKVIDVCNGGDPNAALAFSLNTPYAVSPYEKFVQQNVLAPRRITTMRLGLNGRSLPNEVTYYSAAGENPYGFDIQRLAAHGGWVARAQDLAIFGATAFDGLSPQMTAALQTATAPSKTAMSPYGLGWNISGTPASPTIFHTGSLPGTSSVLWRQASGTAYAALTNTRSYLRKSYCSLTGGRMINALPDLAIDRLGYDLLAV